MSKPFNRDRGERIVKHIAREIAYGLAWAGMDTIMGRRMSDGELTEMLSNVAPPWRKEWFLVTLAFLMTCLPIKAQQTHAVTPLSADEVMARVARMNQQRAGALQNYSSMRIYHLDCYCVVPKHADMVVRVDYQWPRKKEFTVVSESGSSSVRERVFRRLLQAETESMEQENQQGSAIASENYTFTVLSYQKTGGDEFYVLEATPRRRNKFLFRGRIWVDGRDYAIVRVEGEPAVSPSAWTEKTNFTRIYERVGDFWLPASNESVTKVRMFGKASLTIDYGKYEITNPSAIEHASNRLQ